MFQDCDGAKLTVGDEVTILRSQRNHFTAKSHGVIEKFGSKLAHVRLTHARMEPDDGRVFPYDPEELQKGHSGQPRHPRGLFSEGIEQLSQFRDSALDQVLTRGVTQGVITQRQADELRTLE